MNPNNEDTLLPDGIYETLHIAYDNDNMSRFVEIIDGLVKFPKPKGIVATWSYTMNQGIFFDVNPVIERGLIATIKSFSISPHKIQSLHIESVETDEDFETLFIKIDFVWRSSIDGQCKYYIDVVLKFNIFDKNKIKYSLDAVGKYIDDNLNIATSFNHPFYFELIKSDEQSFKMIQKLFLFKIDYL